MLKKLIYADSPFFWVTEHSFISVLGVQLTVVGSLGTAMSHMDPC